LSSPLSSSFVIIFVIIKTSLNHSWFTMKLCFYTWCRNLPFCGRARRGSRMRLPKEENVWSCHQRLFVENVGKTEGNQSWRIFQIRELYLRLRKVLAPLTFVPKDNNLKFRIVWNCVFELLFLFYFEVDKSRALAPTYPPSKRKLDLHSSF